PERIAVVGMGHRPRTAAAGHRSWDTPRYLFVGVDWQRKNGAAVMEAFARVRQEFPAATLDVVGGHPTLHAPGPWAPRHARPQGTAHGGTSPGASSMPRWPCPTRVHRGTTVRGLPAAGRPLGVAAMKAREAVRKSVAAYQNWSDLRWRKPPRLHVGPAAGDPAVYYLSPMETKPSGGVKVIYQHVDALQDLGIRAAVLHAKDGFRCDWFENQTPVVSAATVNPKANDTLAAPECYGPTLHLFPPEIRKVVFNQG